MRVKILEASICGLQKEGLRFSVDTIAKKLKISKKTVYKFFPSKEDLAIAVYEKFYDDIIPKIDNALSEKNEGQFIEILNLYYRSYCIIREDLFNKFALNGSIRELALERHNEIRNKFQNALCSDEKEITVMIVNSVFEKLNGKPLTLKIAKKLERLQ